MGQVHRGNKGQARTCRRGDVINPPFWPTFYQRRNAVEEHTILQEIAQV
jgi:hypothetical protein